jgi:hypothetical protein
MVICKGVFHDINDGLLDGQGNPLQIVIFESEDASRFLDKQPGKRNIGQLTWYG